MVRWKLERVLQLGAAAALTGSCGPKAGDGRPGGTGGPDQDGPPQLIDASFSDPGTVRLTFSEPVAPTEDVDPTQFRLSVGLSYSYGGAYASTYYVDAGYAAKVTETCYEYCDYYNPTDCTEYCYPNYETVPVIVTGLRSVGPTEIELTLTPAISSNTCDFVDQWSDYTNGYGPQYMAEAALFVHYSNNGGQIEDQGGQTLEAIAEHWVLNSSEFEYVEGRYPAMDPYLPIPCPR